MNNIDWRYLQQPLIIFIFSVMIATSMGVVGYQYESTQIAKYDKAVETLRTTHTLYISMVNDIDLLEQYRNLYSGYKSSGLIGKERRLSWIESLKNTNKVLKLPMVNSIADPLNSTPLFTFSPGRINSSCGSRL